MKILGVFAHPDDETFSVGGSLALASERGDDVQVISVTMDQARINEFKKACEILGVKGKTLAFQHVNRSNENEVIEKLVQEIRLFKPDILITHFQEDYHREHRLVRECSYEAIEWASHTTQSEEAHVTPLVYEIETIVLLPRPDFILDITRTIEKKKQAILNYTSQIRKGGEKFYLDYQLSRTRMRGTLIGVEHAEAFKITVLPVVGPFKPKKHYKSFLSLKGEYD